MQRYLKSDKVSTYIQLSAVQKEIVDRSRRRRRLKVWASVGHGSLSLVDALEISFCPKACSYTNGHDLGDDVGGGLFTLWIGTHSIIHLRSGKGASLLEHG